MDIKTIKDFKDIGNLLERFYESAKKDGVNLTEHLDNYSVDDEFDQKIINEIVLWKVNRYVAVEKSDWLKEFNELRNLTDNQLYDNLKDYTYNVKKKDDITKILTKMCNTNGIRLPMASTMLRFRNPKVFQIIDVRTFHIIFGDNNESKIKKKALDANDDNSIDIYFEYLTKLKKDCKTKKILFSDADRILYQYDIEENKKYYIEENKKIKENKKLPKTN